MALLVGLLVCGGSTTIRAHQAPRHRRHACPADHRPDVCGDRGRCDQCPDHQFRLAGKPRVAPSPPPGATTLAARQHPPVNSGVTGGLCFVCLAGGGWFGVGYSPPRAQSRAQSGTSPRPDNGGCGGVRGQSNPCLGWCIQVLPLHLKISPPFPQQYRSCCTPPCNSFCHATAPLLAPLPPNTQALPACSAGLAQALTELAAP
jgi:hypothetical protein